MKFHFAIRFIGGETQYCQLLERVLGALKKYHCFQSKIRELSFLMLCTGVEEFLEGCQIYLPCFIGLPTFLLIHDEAAKF